MQDVDDADPARRGFGEGARADAKRGVEHPADDIEAGQAVLQDRDVVTAVAGPTSMTKTSPAGVTRASMLTGTYL